MRTRRMLRVAGHSLRLALFLLACFAAARFFLGTLARQGWSPGALFGVLLVAGAVSLVWRAGADLRKAVRRARA